MTKPAFTILLPIVRGPELLEFALQSVAGQTIPGYELIIISDGAPRQTNAAAEAAASSDPRITFMAFDKGERHGEAHRHTALKQARGKYVCQIADDDVWFPDHLAQMARLLDDAEFGNTLQTYITQDDQPVGIFTDLAQQSVRERMIGTEFNIFGPTVAGYHRATYDRLETGWSPAPLGLWTDLFMWRKFLTMPGIKTATRFVVTALMFPSPLRKDWPIERRRAENARYVGLIQSDSWRDGLQQQVLREAARPSYDNALDLIAAREALNQARVILARTQRDLSARAEAVEAELASIRASRAWRLTAPLRHTGERLKRLKKPAGEA